MLRSTLYCPSYVKTRYWWNMSFNYYCLNGLSFPQILHCIAWTNYSLSLSVFKRHGKPYYILPQGPQLHFVMFITSWLHHCWPIKSLVEQNNNNRLLTAGEVTLYLNIVKNLKQVKMGNWDLQMQFPSILDCWL